MGKLLARILGEEERPDWIVDLEPVIGRGGEVIRSRMNATLLDRVLRARGL